MWHFEEVEMACTQVHMTCRGGANDWLETRDIGLVMIRGRCKIYVVEGQSLPESERLDLAMRQKLSRLSLCL
jgi:hypothetical protein